MSKKPSATRSFVIRLDGFPPETLSARSKAAARAASFRAFREAGYTADFLWFCRNVRVEAAA
ncbi:hypothetical protein SAMN04487843_105142 [Methylobacterium sp. ap11]|uniref:hypothetical protein n=1 Tax=Methylobacterium sp. ap11 TaxID=1761799 RepID=UPI0008C760F3|nr:hypothetical protein [Methylobacterium sp. ap11]SEO94746.1 hypothetical protein SAMN04487843_105142 [Methylobacterium sp. ap11]